jgi:hypothetical protein
VVDLEQAEIVQKVFELVAEGWGYGRIANDPNDQKIAGPKTLVVKELAKLREQGLEPERPTWSPSGVRELVRRHELYSTGTYTWGRTKRSRKKNSKLRLKREAGDGTIVRVTNPDWIIVEPDLARRALARIDAYNQRRCALVLALGRADPVRRQARAARRLPALRVHPLRQHDRRRDDVQRADDRGQPWPAGAPAPRLLGGAREAQHVRLHRRREDGEPGRVRPGHWRRAHRRVGLDLALW